MVSDTMPCGWPGIILSLTLCTPCLATGFQADTARLAEHLKQLRVHKILEMSAIEFNPIQNEYLAWIDSRIRTGASVTRMNAELAAAHLLSDGPQTVDEWFDKSYAGFLGEVESKPLHPENGLFAITFGIHAGAHCDLDETLVLYARNPIRRIARINAEKSHSHGFRLREFAVGEDNPSRGRMIGSAWVASNCTSTWNGNSFRIDLLRGRSLENVLDEGVGAHYDDELRISIEGETITFNYTTGTGDSSVLTRTAIARYRVQEGRAIRQAPLAPSYGGFIDEWLGMDDTEATRWSSQEAAVQHHDAAAKSQKNIFTWEHAADCPGPPHAREIAVRWNDSKQVTVFLITSSSAAEMRMLSVSNKRSPACREIDIEHDLGSIMAEPSK